MNITGTRYLEASNKHSKILEQGNEQRTNFDTLHIPGEVDTFIAQFEALAEEATYGLNNKATLSLFKAKLLFKMMDHIYKVTRPLKFHEWNNTARQYHQDNTAVQNMRNIQRNGEQEGGIPHIMDSCGLCN